MVHYGKTGIWLPSKAARDGELRSDCGGLPVWELVLRAGPRRRPGACVRDHCESRQTRHGVEAMLAAHVLNAALALTVDTDPAAQAGSACAHTSECSC